jgi:peptidoglycan/xylan/chitin deacetylase (PgdA/CDA1 family)
MKEGVVQQASLALAPADAADRGLARKLAGKASRFLARHTHTKTLVLRNRAPMVSFTFDDVPASACDLGAAILERYGARGTYYVAGGRCGGQSPSGRLAAGHELAALAARGHEIGCHTHAHPPVSAIGDAELAADLQRNRVVLQGIDGANGLRNFAYPYGDYSFRTKRYLESQFDSCRSLLRGVNEGEADLGTLKTIPLENASIDRDDVRDLVAQTVRGNGWLVFYSHDVATPPSRFGTTGDLLAFAAAAARDAGCHIVTVAQALALARAND